MLILYILLRPRILLRVVLGSVVTTGAQAKFLEGGYTDAATSPSFVSTL